MTVQLLQSYATCNDYTIELNGEFSPYGRGGTPFGAFPMYFPSPVGDKMAEVLLSDWTINTLFYSLHKYVGAHKRITYENASSDQDSSRYDSVQKHPRLVRC